MEDTESMNREPITIKTAKPESDPEMIAWRSGIQRPAERMAPAAPPTSARSSPPSSTRPVPKAPLHLSETDPVPIDLTIASAYLVGKAANSVITRFRQFLADRRYPVAALKQERGRTLRYYHTDTLSEAWQEYGKRGRTPSHRRR